MIKKKKVDLDDIELDELDELDGGISNEDLGWCPDCGAADDEGCEADEPHPDGLYW